MSAKTPDELQTLELPIQGMDCMECSQHVQHALCALPRVADAQVYLASEKAVVRYDPTVVDMNAFRQAVAGAGYTLSLPLRTVELKIAGMDCTECTEHVKHALSHLSGVEEAQVFLSSEKAIVRYDPAQTDLPVFHQAVKAAGYTVVEDQAVQEE